MRDILKLSLSLGLICGVVGVILVAANKWTEEPRRQTTEAQRLESMRLVLPATVKNVSDGQPSKVPGVTFFQAFDEQGQIVALAAESVSLKGFGGAVKVLAGLDLQGEIQGVLVLNHGETPGIGTKVTNRKVSQSLWQVLTCKSETVAFPPNACLDSYSGKRLGETPFALNTNGIVGVSGATFSSNAVLDAINQIGLAWREEQDNLRQPKEK